MSKGFPYKDQIGELFIVMIYCMYSQHETFKPECSLFVLKVPLNLNQ